MPDPTLGACAGNDVDGVGAMIFSGAEMCREEATAHAPFEEDAYEDPDDDQRVINVSGLYAPDDAGICIFWTTEADMSVYVDKSHNLCDWNSNGISDQKQKGKVQ